MDASKSSQNIHVVSIGEILWDVIKEQRFAGGAPFNFAYHCAALGGKSSIVSRVGSDSPGDDLVEKAKELHVGTGCLQRDPDYETCIVTARLDVDGSATYTFPDECAWDHIKISEHEQSLLSAAKIMNFGTLAQRNPESRSSIMEAVHHRSPPCIAFLDMNLREPYYDREVIIRSLRAANAVKINEDELRVLTELFNLPADHKKAMLNLLEQFDIETMVVTMGASGSIAVNRNDTAVQLAFNVPVVDTVGCGDAFAAGFALALARGLSLLEVLREASLAGAYVATQSGGTPPYDEKKLQDFHKAVSADR